MCELSQSLLAWYDQHARDLPWRVPPHLGQKGVQADPYHVWLSEIMLQQTTVAAVKDYFQSFKATWPSVFDLAAAPDDAVMAAWAGLGYYARARNLLKTARQVVAEHQGVFPQTQNALQSLPGIGPYTSAAIAAIAYGAPTVVVDGNVERVMSRLFNHHTPLPQAKPQLVDYAAKLTPKQRSGDYAQAVMDLGATICTPKSPKCEDCPWMLYCKAYQAGSAADLPKKMPKKPKPKRLGYAYVVTRSDGAILLETRPNKGLLGGMVAFPSSLWSETWPEPDPPLTANWTSLNTVVHHIFTHFTLELKVLTAKVDHSAVPLRGVFVDLHEFNPAALPNVMKKVFDSTKEQA